MAVDRVEVLVGIEADAVLFARRRGARFPTRRCRSGPGRVSMLVGGTTVTVGKAAWPNLEPGMLLLGEMKIWVGENGAPIG